VISPCGGPLINFLAGEEAPADLKNDASKLPSLQFSERSLCELELLAIGAFSPLDRFMARDDHNRVVEEMRFANGHLFPIPITLPFDASNAEIKLDRDTAPRRPKNDLLATLSVDDIYEWDCDAVAVNVFWHRGFTSSAGG
jgi:sulfate adenylyltransferase